MAGGPGAFEQKKAALEFEDRDDVIDTATHPLDMVQQAVIVKAAADPALFLYALGKSEAKRAELAKIQDPIKLAAAVARMEGAVKVTKGRKAPEPDGRYRLGKDARWRRQGTGEAGEGRQPQAGDRTKLINYKKAKGLLNDRSSILREDTMIYRVPTDDSDESAVQMSGAGSSKRRSSMRPRSRTLPMAGWRIPAHRRPARPSADCRSR
jgi:hypothetical protein